VEDLTFLEGFASWVSNHVLPWKFITILEVQHLFIQMKP
jgi:hypothetical protein